MICTCNLFQCTLLMVAKHDGPKIWTSKSKDYLLLPVRDKLWCPLSGAEGEVGGYLSARPGSCPPLSQPWRHPTRFEPTFPWLTICSRDLQSNCWNSAIISWTNYVSDALNVFLDESRVFFSFPRWTLFLVIDQSTSMLDARKCSSL